MTRTRKAGSLRERQKAIDKVLQAGREMSNVLYNLCSRYEPPAENDWISMKLSQKQWDDAIDHWRELERLVPETAPASTAPDPAGGNGK